MTKVHPTKKRHEPMYIESATGVDARNLSCTYIDRGYSRVGVREGFVMIPRNASACIVILFPAYRGVRI